MTIKANRALLPLAVKLQEAHAKRVRLQADRIKVQDRARTLETAASDAAAVEYDLFRRLVALDPNHATTFLFRDTLYRADGSRVIAERVGVVR